MSAGSLGSALRRGVLRIEDLPTAADPYPGESIYSWLEATRVKLKLEERDWKQWCGFSAEEPERRSDGTEWGSLPLELGRIERIPASWRVGAKWRRMSCTRCFLPIAGARRYPVLIDWLDARAIACGKHRLLLGYKPDEEAMSVDANEDLLALWAWLEQWRHGKIEGRDAALRRDLVLASGRNWSTRSDDIASAELAWSIEGIGWSLPRYRANYRPLGPPRVGGLAPMDRAAALLGAYRAWMALGDPPAPTLPSWPTPAWEWLARRWSSRRDRRLGPMLAGILAAVPRGRR
jgi:hypothetical protein